MKKPGNRKDLLDIYNEFFIKIFNLPREKTSGWQYQPYPWVAAVSGTNFCHIGFDIDEKCNRIVIFSVLDNMGKGGSYAGVQNMNLMLGLDERTGLKHLGLHPY